METVMLWTTKGFMHTSNLLYRLCTSAFMQQTNKQENKGTFKEHTRQKLQQRHSCPDDP